MKNILGDEMTELPSDADRCSAERWDKKHGWVRCEYVKHDSGDHVRATGLWALIWPQEQP